MQDAGFTLSPQGEAQLLALEYMRQKSLTDDAPADMAREYRALEQQLLSALLAGNQPG